MKNQLKQLIDRVNRIRKVLTVETDPSLQSKYKGQVAELEMSESLIEFGILEEGSRKNFLDYIAKHL